MTSQGQSAPFVCRFSAFTPEQKTHYRELRDWLAAAKVRETSHGYAFDFEPSEAAVKQVAEFAYLEGICCPFLSFSLKIGEDHSSLSLELTGREGVKQFLAAELDLSV
ncbi:MAG: hypothetical protein HYX26_00535 [Acidobacteriales bacterium]|nr:hypothetical protein [Terriglobales bacterium]